MEIQNEVVILADTKQWRYKKMDNRVGHICKWIRILIQKSFEPIVDGEMHKVTKVPFLLPAHAPTLKLACEILAICELLLMDFGKLA